MDESPKQLSEVPVPPEEVKFWNTAVGKTLRASIYLALSAGISGIIAARADNADLFGIFTPIVNIVLVLLKGVVDPNVRNI